MGKTIGTSRVALHGLSCGRLPPGCGYIGRLLKKYRVAVEAAVLDSRGEIGPWEAGVIQSAVRWEMVAQLAQRWMHKAPSEQMSPDKAIEFAAKVAQASANRDKCLSMLRLDGGDCDAMSLTPRRGRPPKRLGGVYNLPDFDIDPEPTRECPTTPASDEGADSCQ